MKQNNKSSMEDADAVLFKGRIETQKDKLPNSALNMLAIKKHLDMFNPCPFLRVRNLNAIGDSGNGVTENAPVKNAIEIGLKFSF